MLGLTRQLGDLGLHALDLGAQLRHAALELVDVLALTRATTAARAWSPRRARAPRTPAMALRGWGVRRRFTEVELERLRELRLLAPP